MINSVTISNGDVGTITSHLSSPMLFVPHQLIDIQGKKFITAVSTNLYMSAALFEASWEGLKCSSAGLPTPSAPVVPQLSNSFFRRRALKVHLRLREDQGRSAFEQRGCRDGQFWSKVQAYRREGGPALADLHTGSRGQLYGNVNGVDVSGAGTAGREELSPVRLKAEGPNGAHRSDHAFDSINGAERTFAKEIVANRAGSVHESSSGDPAAEDSRGPASAKVEAMQGADEPAASARSAKNRLQMDLDRQRSKEGMNLAMRSRKEVLRQLRTGEEGGLPEAERLRRLRISAANKGRAPWNVGRKHSPGTSIVSTLDCCLYAWHYACHQSSGLSSSALQHAGHQSISETHLP